MPDSLKSIAPVLIANRGEIAVRVIRACRSLGLKSVVTVSEADRDSLAARLADRAVCIGPARSTDSYLKVGTIITAARGVGARSIHPGYGFLAEQPELARACAENGLKFIGPSAGNLKNMGNKLFAREMAESLGVPTIPGSARVGDWRQAVARSKEIGFPILLKAAAGGGGKGIVIVTDPDQLKSSFASTSAEVKAAFGDGTLFLERYIPNARHIEVQIAADRMGSVVHLGERDCSVQRRYQKVIEEAPSTVVSDETRELMCRAAVRIARHINYENMGTVEFVLDRDSGRFHFLEMNTRIQVEHTVTEMVTGLDLVAEQLKIAAGQPLSFSQGDVETTGHAVECRITAEAAAAGFRPSPGRIEDWDPPKGRGIRVDSHGYAGYMIPPYYDSLLAKLITWGGDRAEALARMEQALGDFRISGVETTLPFLSSVVSNPDYLAADINTRWLENLLQSQGGRSE